MVWAIVNRHCRGMTIKAVGFPIHHLGRVTATPTMNIEKVQGEIVGSGLYAGLTGFLRDRPRHTLDFDTAEAARVADLAEAAIRRRLGALEQSFHRIAGLGSALREAVQPGQLDDLLQYLDRWFTRANFERIRAGVQVVTAAQIVRFLTSLRQTARDYASRSVDIDFIHQQWRCAVGFAKEAGRCS